MAEEREWYVRTADGNVYGPANDTALIRWAEEGRIEPSSRLSQDRERWFPAQEREELAMEWLVETQPGDIFGPFNCAVVQRLFAEGKAPKGARVYRRTPVPAAEEEAEKPFQAEVIVPEVLPREGEAAVSMKPPPNAGRAKTRPSLAAALESALRRELRAQAAHGRKRDLPRALFGKQRP